MGGGGVKGGFSHGATDENGIEAVEGRDVKPEDNGNLSPEKLTPAFPVKHKVLRAKGSACVISPRLCATGLP